MRLAYATRGLAASMQAKARMEYSGRTFSGHLLWTPDEDRKVAEWYPDYALLRRLLPHRTFRSLQARARTLHVVKPRHRWTAKEISLLRKMYPDASREEILAFFPGMNWKQVAARARYAGYRRARKPYKQTGYQPIDDILQFAFENNMTLADIDAFAGSKTYFQSQQWVANGFTGHKAVLRAAIALGGKISIQWED